MDKIHKSRPEPVLFLLEALDAMLEYHETHKEFPKKWYLLDIHFANGPFRIGDPNTDSTTVAENKWRPKDCKYIYWIKESTKKSFVIQAINQKKISEYEITEKLKKPIYLLDKKIKSSGV